jgi:lipopolysaccharide/colanic/teichoic acid biosynthesis glycosyltransferase
MVTSSASSLLPVPESTAFPLVWDRLRPATRNRRLTRRPGSLFQLRLAAGETLVPAEGNLAASYLAAKRAMDIAGALVLLALLAPVMLLSLAVLFITTRGKPIFRQVRLGWQGRPFVMYKFRTMVVGAEQRRSEVPNEQSGPVFKNRRDWRVTRFGRFLRRTSLDETPQLLNVLAGQMSLVGPRPPLAHEVARYKPWQRRRLAVRPGLTCFWQVGGRSEIAFEDWARLDLRYVRLQGLAIDLGLLLKTPWSVLSGRGAY